MMIILRTAEINDHQIHHGLKVRRGNDREWTLGSREEAEKAAAGEAEQLLLEDSCRHFEAGAWGNKQLGFSLLAKLQLPLE